MIAGIGRHPKKAAASGALLTGWIVGAIVLALPLSLAGFPEAAPGTILLLALPAAWVGKRRGEASAAL